MKSAFKIAMFLLTSFAIVEPAKRFLRQSTRSGPRLRIPWA